MFWDYWFERAKDGDPFCARLVLSSVADEVNKSDLPFRYKQYLVPALKAIATAETLPAQLAAVKKHLVFARRPGSKPRYQVKDRNRMLAQAVWDKVGDASGARLDRACEEVAFELGIGKPGNRAPDIRGIKNAYFEWRPAFIEIEAEMRGV